MPNSSVSTLNKPLCVVELFLFVIARAATRDGFDMIGAGAGGEVAQGREEVGKRYDKKVTILTLTRIISVLSSSSPSEIGHGALSSP